MSRITLYLDDATQALVGRAAAASGMPKSRWVAELIRKHAMREWPQDCLNLAGRFEDFPLRNEVGAKESVPDAANRQHLP